MEWSLPHGPYIIITGGRSRDVWYQLGTGRKLQHRNGIWLPSPSAFAGKQQHYGLRGAGRSSEHLQDPRVDASTPLTFRDGRDGCHS